VSEHAGIERTYLPVVNHRLGSAWPNPCLSLGASKPATYGRLKTSHPANRRQPDALFVSRKVPRGTDWSITTLSPAGFPCPSGCKGGGWCGGNGRASRGERIRRSCRGATRRGRQDGGEEAAGQARARSG